MQDGYLGLELRGNPLDTPAITMDLDPWSSIWLNSETEEPSKRKQRCWQSILRKNRSALIAEKSDTLRGSAKVPARNMRKSK